MRRFAQAVGDLELDDFGATSARAHGYFANALTRLAYVTHEPETLAQAVEEIEQHGLDKAEFPELWAANQRDLGDAYIGQAHWAKESTRIDGSALRALDQASRVFAENSKLVGDELFDEWAAAQSSLSVALAKAALEIKTGGCEVAPGFCSKTGRGKKVKELAARGKAISWRIWHVYLWFLHLLEDGESPSFRWARTVSNLAHASLYIYEVNRDDVMSAALSEAAFASILGEPKQVGHGLGVAEMWYGEAVEQCVRYDLDNHRNRFMVNQEGLKDLYGLMGDVDGG